MTARKGRTVTGGSVTFLHSIQEVMILHCPERPLVYAKDLIGSSSASWNAELPTKRKVNAKEMGPSYAKKKTMRGLARCRCNDEDVNM